MISDYINESCKIESHRYYKLHMPEEVAATWVEI